MGRTLRNEVDRALEAAGQDLAARNGVLKAYIDYLIPPFNPAKALLDAKMMYDLTLTEAMVLYKLSTPFERVVEREEVILSCSPAGSGMSYRSVDSHIKRLRKKLPKFGITICTHYGIGYSAWNDGGVTLPWNSAGKLHPNFSK